MDPTSTPRLPDRLTPIRELVGRHTNFNGQDMRAVETALAAAVANQWSWETVRIWLQLVGPPSCGKTLSLLFYKGWTAAHFIDTLTPHALCSAYNQDEGEDHSLLPLVDRRILVIKDFSSIMGLPTAQSAQILGDLRAAYDHSFNRHSGVGGRNYNDVRFGILAACTSSLYDWLAQHSELGERFLLCRMGGDEQAQPYEDREHKMLWILEQAARRYVWLAEIQELVQKSLTDLIRTLHEQEFRTFVEARQPLDLQKKLIAVADLATKVRTNPAASSIVDPEGPPRLLSQFQRMVSARAVLSGRTEIDESDLAFAAALARDSVHPNFLTVLKLLYGGNPGQATIGSAVSTLAERTLQSPHRLAVILKTWTAWGLTRLHAASPPKSRQSGYSGRYCLTPDTAARIQSCKLLENL